jgi:hypothetical protein
MALYAVVAGNQALAADLNQFMNFLTGLTNDQMLAVNKTSGYGLQLGNAGGGHTYGIGVDSLGEFLLDDIYAGVRRLMLYPSGGLYLGTTTSDPGANNLQVQGRITSSAVGASGKPLLNRVFLADPLPSQTLTGTGDHAQATFTITGLPASAVSAVLQINLLGSTLPAGAAIVVGNKAFTTTYSMCVVIAALGVAMFGQGETKVVPGSTLQADYQVVATTGVAWSAGIRLVAYDEPA